MQGEFVLGLYALTAGHSEIVRYFKWVFILLLIILTVYMLSKRRAVFHAISAAIFSLLISMMMHLFINSSRPFADYGIGPLINHAANTGFPSNHAAVSFAMAASLLMYNKRIGIIALLAACGLGIIRVAAALHYPLDIFMGAAIGTLAAIMFWHALK